MKLYLDTDTWLLSTAPGATNTTVVINAKQGTDLEVEVIPSSSLPDGTQGTLVVKPKDDYAAASVSWDLEWDAPATSGSGWLFRLPLSTEALAALFTGTLKTVQLMAEITITHEGQVSKTQTFTIPVARQIAGGEEGTPAVLPDLKADTETAQAGTDDTRWMTPLKTAQAIEALKADTETAQAGTDDTRWMTPLKTAQAIAALAGNHPPSSAGLFPPGSNVESSGGQYPSYYMVKNAGGAVIGILWMSYNENGQIQQIETRNEDYDPIPYGGWTITYDGAGNFLSAINIF